MVRILEAQIAGWENEVVNGIRKLTAPRVLPSHHLVLKHSLGWRTANT